MCSPPRAGSTFSKKNENYNIWQQNLPKEGLGADMAPKKERMRGAMDKMTAVMHRNIFVVGPSVGKNAQVTDENAIIDLALDWKKPKRARKGATSANTSNKHAPYGDQLGVKQVHF